MINFEPYFHVGHYELARAMHEENPKISVVDYAELLCNFFDIDYSHYVTQIVYTSYDDMLVRRSTSDTHWFWSLLVDVLQRDNPNVVAFAETFIIEF